MKKALTPLLAGSLVTTLSLTACGGNTNPATEETVEETTTETTEDAEEGVT